MRERKSLAAKLGTSEAGLHLASLPEKGDNKCNCHRGNRQSRDRAV
ncbi:MAG: hypothetical protein Q8865_04965 [Bacillota bacterium]|nr:hypothetical protein [Bacillota bacterium]